MRLLPPADRKTKYILTNVSQGSCFHLKYIGRGFWDIDNNKIVTSYELEGKLRNKEIEITIV
jgi:hypothetical protein